MNLNFGAGKDGQPKPWHFTNTAASLTKNAGALKGVEQSKVMKRLYSAQSKASFTSKKRKAMGMGNGAWGAASIVVSRM